MNHEASYWVTAALTSPVATAEFERTPFSERGLPASTYQMLMDGCSVDPDKVAIHYFTDGARPFESCTQITFGQLRAKVNQTANLFSDLGIQGSDVVSVLMPAVPEAQYVLWGGQAVGIVNPVNWMLEPATLVQMLQAANTRLLVAYGDDDNISIWPKVAHIAAQLPNLKAVVRVNGSAPCPSALGGVPVIDYAAALVRHPADRLVAPRDIRATDIAGMFHTGGTTGAPKLALHRHSNQVFATWASAMVSQTDRQDVRACGVPIFHVAGALISCYAPLARGASLVLMTSAGWRHPSVLPNFWRIVEAFGVSIVPLVPTVIGQLVETPLQGADIQSLRYVSSTTAPLSVAVAERFAALTGIEIREGFGMTETTAGTCITPAQTPPRIGSVGLRVPYQELRVVRLGGEGQVLEECGAHEPGVLLVRGPGVFAGYLDGAAKSVWVDGDWLNSGDLGYIDGDGYVWLTGRAKDLIIRGGHNIDPRMVEEAFYSHPGVAEVAVVGAPEKCLSSTSRPRSGMT